MDTKDSFHTESNLNRFTRINLPIIRINIKKILQITNYFDWYKLYFKLNFYLSILLC